MVATLVRAHFGGLDEERRDLLFEPHDGRWWENQGEYWMATGVRAFFREWLDYGGLGRQAGESRGRQDLRVDGRRGRVQLAEHDQRHLRLREHPRSPSLDDMIARIVAGDQDVYGTIADLADVLHPGHRGYQEGESLDPEVDRRDEPRLQRPGRHPDDPRGPLEAAAGGRARAGVLTHPAWLGAHSLSFENDPNLVHRGKWIREELLCQNIPDLPLNVAAMLTEASRRQRSARQRISEQIDADPYVQRLLLR